MRIIQYFLILLFILMVIFYFKHWRNHLKDRILLLAFAIAASLVVLFPDISTSLAALTGVGRGVDFVIYLSVAGLSFFCVMLYAQLREMDRRFTELTRTIALKTSQDNKPSILEKDTNAGERT